MTSAGTIAVLPVKCFERAKSRLGPRLGDSARARLARRLFDHVLSSVLACGALSDVLVVTDGAEVAALASGRGALVWPDPIPNSGLSAVVDAALERAAELGAQAALVLMADLPVLRSSDLDELLARCDGGSVVLAPDQRGRCTNALALPLHRGFRSAFGDPDSFSVHARRARALDLHVQRIDNPRIAHDIDIPSDLDAVARLSQD